MLVLNDEEMQDVSDSTETFDKDTTVEITGYFSDRKSFTAAVKALTNAGFEHDDISVLDTHESLSAAGTPSEAWQETLSGMVGEIKFVGPLTDAGLIALGSGPIGAAVAAAVAAGLSGAALVDLLGEVRATPHTEAFARALEAGSILLWVRVDSEAGAKKAEALLTQHGGSDVHRHVK